MLLFVVVGGGVAAVDDNMTDDRAADIGIGGMGGSFLAFWLSGSKSSSSKLVSSVIRLTDVDGGTWELRVKD